RSDRRDLHVAERDANACASTIASTENLQVSPLRMTIKPSCFGRDDSYVVVHSYITLFVTPF
ncbi:MAG TPA: hypothetical protein VGG18_02890, partial [Granulicella sp.]